MGLARLNGHKERPALVYRIPPEQVFERSLDITALLVTHGATEPLGTTEEILRKCMSGHWQFWTATKANQWHPFAGMLTEIAERPNGRYLVLLWVGGKDLKKVFEFFQPFEQWAAQIGCVGFEAYVRKGLTRVLAPLGFEVEQYVVRKRIER